MHFNNIMTQFAVYDEERHAIKKYFHTNVVSHSAVVDFIEGLRK